ncbi:hypothetical protein L6164_034657 [Bauhinia variegata]|nr:hypothetical protein L6164_034657 [Bauhinia variegata]
MPIGKACSSLSSADIIKFLTGDFRLSKARSNDLFWEAVWPRLLAKGWHSEQPKNYAGFGSKQSLVFLIPGVKKFSRRKLVKGNHYFDSVSDVLNKVASEPGLINIEVPASESSANGEDRQDKQGLDGVLPKQQHCYLQLRTSNCSQNKMKFTIVDTSMVNGLEQRKVRELRSLPSETISTPTPSSHSSESEQDTSEESEDEAEKTNTSNPVEESSNKAMSIDSSDCIHIPEAPNATKVAVKNNKCHSYMLNDDQRKTNKHQFIQKEKSGCSQDFPPIMKKHKLMACNGEEFCQLTESASRERMLDLNEFASSSNEGNAIDNQEGGEEVSAEKPETRMLIDLNLPHIEPETEMDRTQQNNDDQCANTSSFSFEEIKFDEIDEFPDDHIEQQPTNVSRRQSTRNRPLTAKALEALEYSFLNSKRKRKNVETSQNNTTSSQSLFLSGRPSVSVSVTCDNGADNVMTDTRAGEENLIPAYSKRMINLNSEPDYNF